MQQACDNMHAHTHTLLETNAACRKSASCNRLLEIDYMCVLDSDTSCRVSSKIEDACAREGGASFFMVRLALQIS